ncbi:uncharacterized protein HD556DRAFT_1313496 [Suillus plorans]|uniref:Uncharacterized protein n=1 Tax=Suillus plorans TaxID=116603 RepID=A0A9P7AD90_9AGAM|nr:uncharacterized protein HD556DRAFT_1313496 [Suillus plorans]KAG1786490.1 hypothetical protein HD556DRAFT_1313496 [Suillus plorans]
MLKGMEDNGPSFETPGIFYEMVWSSRTPEVTNISKHPNKFLPTLLKATEDDGPSLETPGIFYEVVGLVHLVVRGGWTPEVINISKYSNNSLPTILKVTEDDRISFGLPIIFCDAKRASTRTATHDQQQSEAMLAEQKAMVTPEPNTPIAAIPLMPPPRPTQSPPSFAEEMEVDTSSDTVAKDLQAMTLEVKLDSLSPLTVVQDTINDLQAQVANI